MTASGISAAIAKRAADEQPERHARQEHDGDTARGDHQRGAEIGLQHDQRGRHGDHRQCRPDRAEPPRFVRRQQIVEARDREHDGGLHQFGGLQPHDPQIEPTLAAPAYRAEQFDENEQDDEHAVNG